MPYAQYRRSHTANRRQRAIGVFTVFMLLAAAAVALATLPSRSVAAKSDVATNSTEHFNHRISVRSAGANATLNILPTPLVTITVDRTDDDATASAALCTPAANDCSLRGAVAFANLVSGTTIVVPAGTYQLNIPGGAGEGLSGNNSIGDLDVRGNDTIITGAGAGTTIIQQTQPNDRVLEINPDLLSNFNSSISDVTLTGGKDTTGVGGGGIISGAVNNNMTVTNCVISGNSATGAGTLGGGGISHLGGNLTITGTTFSNNSTSASGGGISYSAGAPVVPVVPSAGTLSISGSRFSGNTANSGAAGGGALDLFNFNISNGAYNINSSTFSSNSAPNGRGGAIVVESGPLTLTTSSLSANTAGVAGGAIYSSGSASVSYSRLFGNSVPIATNGLTLFTVTPSFTADDNWWGVSTGPSANDFRNTSGTVPTLTHLQLRASFNPSEICAGQSSTITADIKQRNIGSPLTAELNGLPGFGVAPIFTNAVLGTISGASTQYVDGVATATYTAGGTNGMGSVDATADNDLVTASINISSNDTSDPADQSVCQGATATFSTTASGGGPFSYAWTLDGDPFNGDSPSIDVPTGSLSVGPHTVTVTTTGACGSVSRTATLTVQATTVASDPADATVCQGATASFSTTATGGDVHYAWTLDGSPFNGDSSSINVPTGALSVGSHAIELTVRGSCGTVSQSATLTVNANTAASDPADQTVCQGATASFATTATGTDLHYAWTLDASPFNGDSPSINVPTGSLSVGSHTIGLTVTGSCGTVSQTATLMVNANTATTDPPDQTVCRGVDAHFSTTASGTGPFNYAWTLDGSPFNGNSPSITVPTGSLTAGPHTVTVTTTGSCGSATQTAILTVTNPIPVITLSSSSATMWPPNHQYQTFNVSDFVASATGGCDSTQNLTGSVVIQTVSSDEPEDNPSGGDGNTLNDIVIAANCKSVQLRRERDGNLNGRVYTITFAVADSFGNTGTATVKVYVPKNNNETAVDNGAAAGYTVISACP